MFTSGLRKNEKMFQKEKSMSLKSSSSALCNNLSVIKSLEKKMIYYAVVHKSVVNLVSALMDGSSVNHRQVVCKDPSATQSVSMILQVRLNLKLTNLLHRLCICKHCLIFVINALLHDYKLI